MHSSPKTILLLLLCGLGGFVKAQTVWNKTYIEDRPLMLFSSVVADSGFYYVTGVTFDNSGIGFGYDKVLIGKLDSNGDLVKYIYFYDSVPQNHGAFNNTLIRDPSGRFLLTG